MFRGLAPWLNWLPGRLMHVNVLACGLFGSVSGSSAATCATVAKLALPELKKRGYDDTVSLGSLAGAGTLGILIPPSITMVVYAVAANASIIQIFLAGFLPGFLVMALYSGYIIVWALLNPKKQPPAEPKMSFRMKLRESAQLVPVLLLIILVFVTLIAGWVDSLHLSPYALIAALTVMYIVLGTALDGISMIVLTTAVVIPMIKSAGFDLVWFGIFVVLVVEMAEVSPPVGFNLFVLQTMSGKDSNTVARASLPFFFLLVVAVALITIFPSIVMVVPRYFYPV
jgi:TRAP-type C4-dicarboxylate transport system permease large subunit